MKYKLKVEYDPKMPLDRYELIYNPQDLELLKKLGEKKEEKGGKWQGGREGGKWQGGREGGKWQISIGIVQTLILFLD